MNGAAFTAFLVRRSSAGAPQCPFPAPRRGVEVRPPCGGAGRAVEYWSRYTHRVAISKQRLLSFEQRPVRFRWRHSAPGNQQRLMTLELDEFLRRFLLPAHSLLRLLDELETWRFVALVPPADRSRLAHDRACRFRTRSQRLGLSSLWRPLAPRRTLYRSPAAYSHPAPLAAA